MYRSRGFHDGSEDPFLREPFENNTDTEQCSVFLSLYREIIPLVADSGRGIREEYIAVRRRAIDRIPVVSYLLTGRYGFEISPRSCESCRPRWEEYLVRERQHDRGDRMYIRTREHAETSEQSLHGSQSDCWRQRIEVLPALHGDADAAIGSSVRAGIPSTIVRVECWPPRHDALAAEREGESVLLGGIGVQKYERRALGAERVQIEHEIMLADERRDIPGVRRLGVSGRRIVEYDAIQIRARVSRHGRASRGIGYRHERHAPAKELRPTRVQRSNEAKYRLGAGRLIAVHASEHEHARTMSG